MSGALCLVEVRQVFQLRVDLPAGQFLCERSDGGEQDQDEQSPGRALHRTGAASLLVLVLVRFVGLGLGLLAFRERWVGVFRRRGVRGERRVVEVNLEQREFSTCHGTIDDSTTVIDGGQFIDIAAHRRCMDDTRRAFLEALLSVPGPSGFEARGQRVWIDHVEAYADEVQVDDYGNAVATYHGDDGPSVALAGHGDQIGLIVRRIEEKGFLRVGRIGGTDRTVTQGRRVVAHGDDGPVPGVVGQTAIHLRDTDTEGSVDVDEQYVDIGAADGDEARELVSVGDPVTVASEGVVDLAGNRLTAAGLDNRVGVWSAAEGLRRAAAAEVDATVHAVSTVQEEVGLQGARMVGEEMDLNAVVAIDVTHAGDHPGLDTGQRTPIDLGGGPVVVRGSANHPVLVDEARAAADDDGIAVQLQASGSRTGTDADAFYVAGGGTPTLSVGIPNRYMHTPAEVVDAEDLTDTARLMGSLVGRLAARDSFTVDV